MTHCDMTQETGFNDERAKGYDERVRRHIPGYEILHALSETILAAELPEKAAVLVAGVGTGMEILDWAPKHPGWRFVAVDPSEAMIAVAREKVSAASLSARVQLKAGTVDTLPEGPYDAATLLLVLHFLPDNGEKEEILSAIAHRLKPGAPFVMATMFGDPETTRHKRLIALTQSWAITRGMDPAKAAELCNPARTDLHIVPEERVKNLLRYAGFIDIQRVYQALTIGVWLARTSR
jgi:tRNA (cmo5U34)-methyltransferase